MVIRVPLASSDSEAKVNPEAQNRREREPSDDQCGSEPHGRGPPPHRLHTKSPLLCRQLGASLEERARRGAAAQAQLPEKPTKTRSPLNHARLLANATAAPLRLLSTGHDPPPPPGPRRPPPPRGRRRRRRRLVLLRSIPRRGFKGGGKVLRCSRADRFGVGGEGAADRRCLLAPAVLPCCYFISAAARTRRLLA
jgi:hypothetical protein